MSVNFEYYKIFYYVAKYQNITKAACVLKNSQPNVSRTIRLLESQLNCQLFIREPRGLRLTQCGERLYSHVEIACQHLLNAEEELNFMETDCKGTVEIGVTETALHLFLLQTLYDFKLNYPEIKIKIKNDPTPELLKALMNGEIDFAVLTTPFTPSKRLHCEKILEFHETLAGGTEYSKVATRKMTLDEICAYPLIGLSKGTATYEFYKTVFLKQHLDYRPDMEVATSDLMLPLLQNNLGIGFVAEALAAPLFQKNCLVKIDLDLELPVREVQIASEKGRGKSRATDTFYKYLKTRKEDDDHMAVSHPVM